MTPPIGWTSPFWFLPVMLLFGVAVAVLASVVCTNPGVELRARLRPSLTGWMAHPAPFDFEPPPMKWRDDAYRFLLGTPAIPALYAAVSRVR